MDDLRESLRSQASFVDIGKWFVANTPIRAVEFSRIRRIETIPMDAEGNVMDAWYARESKDLRGGWTTLFVWTVPSDSIWAARDFILSFNLFTLAPLTVKDRRRTDVVVQQSATLLADNFPAMWLAQKLTGRVE